MSRICYEDGRASFRCPGCGHIHSLPVTTGHSGNSGPTWGFNGDLEKPTLKPSILATGGCYADPACCQGEGAKYCDREMAASDSNLQACVRCHCYVTDGRIEFLPDSSHSLAGKTVDLPERDP